ncbi:MAG: glutathione S-transferase family protein [Rhodobacter sp.]|nr:glutathione S-transferase family protein [Rhodobacter sp.]
MLTIYGTLRSRTTRVVWAAEELGLPYRRETVVFASALPDPQAAGAPLNTASAAFLAVNPMGQLPAMRDGDLCLGESHAICFYMARKAGGPVAPDGAAEEAEALQWAFLAASTIEPQAIEVLYTVMGGTADTAEGKARIAAALDKLVRPMRRIETHLQSHEWLVGGRFTIADIMMEETLRYVAAAPGAFDASPALKAWFDRCQARPGFQRMWTARNAE